MPKKKVVSRTSAKKSKCYVFWFFFKFAMRNGEIFLLLFGSTFFFGEGGGREGGAQHVWLCGKMSSRTYAHWFCETTFFFSLIF